MHTANKKIAYLDLPHCDIESIASSNPSTIGDGICHDENNHEGCFFDFGDCCHSEPGKNHF